MLEKVRPTKCADSTLYTLALEFHHKPSTYDGPNIQLVKRKVTYTLFDFVNHTSNTMIITKGTNNISITKTGSSAWDGLCVAQVNTPTEQQPVYFQFSLTRANSDRSGIQIVVRSLSEALSPSNFSGPGGMDGGGFNIGDEVDGIISLKGDTITTTIGHKSSSITKQGDGIYFCIYLHYHNDSITFSA